MVKIIDKIKENKHLRKNGERVFKIPYCIVGTPTKYLDEKFEINSLPQHMINKTEYREPNGYCAVENEIRGRITEIFNDKTKLLKPYEAETPRNKLQYWGALFETVVDFVSANLPEYKRPAFINDDKYDTIPKRYRSAIQNHNGMHTVVKTEDSNTYIQSLFAKTMDNPGIIQYDMFDNSEAGAVNQQIETIRKLLPIIYKPDIISREIQTVQESDNTMTIRQIFTYGAKPSTESKAKQQRVTDEEVDVFDKLYQACQELTPKFYYVASKSNTHDIIEEYKREQNNKDIVLKAQRHLRSAQQVVVSAKKNSALLDEKYIADAEDNYNDIKKRVLSMVHDKIHPNTL